MPADLGDECIDCGSPRSGDHCGDMHCIGCPTGRTDCADPECGKWICFSCWQAVATEEN